MAKKRPCRICRAWFPPDPRAGDRQHVCSKPACQRERHRRDCADWRKRHPDYDAEERVRRRLLCPDASGSRETARQVDPLEAIDWRAAGELVGLKTRLLVEESGQVLVDWARDAVRREAAPIRGGPG